MTQFLDHPLRLQRFPDGRRGRMPLATPVVLGYTAFLLGAGGAALLGLWNAALLRRPSLFLWTLLLGAAGWAGFGAMAVALVGAGVKTPQLVLLAGRLAGIAFGIALAALHARHVRGHLFLDGAVIPILPAVLAGFALQYVLAPRVLLAVQGLWPLFFSR
jgi:hypothetical protein